MRTKASFFQTAATGATVSVPMPGNNIRLRGIALSIALEGTVANSYAWLQVATSSGPNNSSVMENVLAMLTAINNAASAITGSNSIYVPIDYLVNQYVYVHASSSGGATGYFATVLYFD